MDLSSLSPADAAVALRSLPRRWRGVLVRGDEEETDRPEHLVRRAGVDGWSALDHAHSAAAAMRAHAGAVDAVLVRDDPAVSDADGAGGAGSAGDISVGAALDELAAAAESLASRIERVDAAEWSRAGTAGDTKVTALDLVRQAVDAGVSHLRAAERVIDEVRGRS